MKLEVFEKYSRRRIDMIREYNYVSYTNDFYGEGSFSIKMPTTDSSLPNLVEGNYIYFEDDVVGIIKGRRDTENAEIEIEIYGYLLNKILSYRSTLYAKRYYGTYTDVIKMMATEMFINPSNVRRKIDYVTLSEDEQYMPQFGKKVTVQKTGDDFLSIISELGMANDFSVRLFPILVDKEDQGGSIIEWFEIRVIKPVYRTIDNEDENNPVVFSFDLNNLEQIEYEEDGRAYCSVAFVASEGEGTERKTLEVGDINAEGIDRIEVYVDARDIQSENGSGSGDGGTGGGDDGNTGTGTNPSGIYGFEVRDDGCLWIIANKKEEADKFFIDSDGNLCYNIEKD